MSAIKHVCLLALALSATSPAHAECLDLSDGNSFTLTRNAPFLEVQNTVSSNGTVIEERVMQKDGSTQKVTTTYWNGLIAVDRQSPSSHIQLQLDSSARAIDLGIAGKTHKLPVSIVVGGNEIDSGSFVLKTMGMTELKLGGCKYPVMVVRTSIERNNGAAFNEEALLSLEAGMLLGNVVMSDDWQAEHGVFFDKIEKN